MYGLLLRYLPPWAAETVLVLWYLLLIALLLLALDAPSGEFRYGDL
jgi:hypothetical protein